MAKTTGGLVAVDARSGAKLDSVVAEARSLFQEQAAAVAALGERLDENFGLAVQALLRTVGRVVVLGVGKSGLIGRKLASTLASTGTPSFFVSAAEAHHGDLGMITPNDTAILISFSGETDEVVGLLPHLRRIGVTMVALVGSLDSTLARTADIALDVSVDREVCPNNLAPTNSTLASLAMGDALAVSLARQRSFGAADFARLHPGGSLGRQLYGRKRLVRDVMRQNDLPMVEPGAPVSEAIDVMSRGGMGLVLVVDGKRLVGLVTDGDLRRGMQRYDDLMIMAVREIMTRNPVTVRETTPLYKAQQRMVQMKLKALVVTDSAGRVAGVTEVFDSQ